MTVDYTDERVKRVFRSKLEKEMLQKMFDVAGDNTSKKEIVSRSEHAIYVANKILEDTIRELFPDKINP